MYLRKNNLFIPTTMRRLALLLLATIFCGLTVSYAQTQQQQVVVKTRGRLTTKRAECQPVVQAIVTPKGASSGVYSDSRGCARFGVPATDGYYISSVYKENYELFDKSWALFTEHHYSKEPLVIYMDNKDELREYEYVTAQRYRTMYDAEIKRLKARIDSLERNGLATQQELQALKAEYYRNLEEVEKIVTDATKRYLLINFDKLEDEDIKFYELFNSGNIKAAKAFLKSPSEIERMTRDANITSAALDNMYEDIDRHCMGWCEVYSSEFKRDSVAYMLELRAAANRKNVDWQLEAASYIKNFLGDYDRALDICEPTLEYCKEHYGELHEKTATLYNNIGLVYDHKGEYDNALEYYKKAREIREKVLDPQHPSLATTYNNIGVVYAEKGEYDNALEYYNKAKEIYEKILPNDSLDLAGLYFFMAVSYVQTQDFGNALIYLEKSLVGLEKHNKAFAEEIKSIIEQLKARVQQE